MFHDSYQRIQTSKSDCKLDTYLLVRVHMPAKPKVLTASLGCKTGVKADPSPEAEPVTEAVIKQILFVQLIKLSIYLLFHRARRAPIRPK